MDPQKNYEQVRYNNVESRGESVGSANQRFFLDPSSNINTNIRPPDYNVPVGARPVLNYSIQTGEEFSLEFMRERVNPRQPSIPNAYGDPNTGHAYMDLKGILGKSHTGSESGSDISMVVNAAERGRVQDFERKPPSHESMRSVPRSSSKNEIGQGHQGYASSGTGFSSSRALKFLCSFGGKILPRPGDAKLRYVGGDTRIIRISRDISWQELVQKTSAIYNQVHAIKYQLPGEDLDALVSVSCDEDLQNMMEECNLIDNGGSQKPRVFLFSSSDLEDAQYGLSNMEGDSELQYVVAVNGMDLGSRRNSVNLASDSEKNLAELLSLNVEREVDRTVSESAGASTAAFSVNAPSPAIQPAQPQLTSSSSAYGSSSHPYIEQRVHYGEVGQQVSSNPLVDGKISSSVSAPLQYVYGSHPPKYMIPGETVVPMPLHVHLTPQASFSDEKVRSGLKAQDPEVQAKEVKLKRDSSAPKLNEAEVVRSMEKPPPAKDLKMKRDASFPKINETDNTRKSETDYVVPSHGSVSNYSSREEALATNSAADVNPTLLSTKSFKKPQESFQNPVVPEVKNEGKNNEDAHVHAPNKAYTSGGGASQADSTSDSYLEPSLVPQPVFHSERIPREQTEMNRLSKSDDSFGSQFLMTQGHSDGSQPVTDPVSKIHESNVASQVDQSVKSSKSISTNPQTVKDGYVEGLESKLKSELNHVAVNSMSNHEKGRVKGNYTDGSAEKEAPRSSPQPTSEGAKHLEDPSLRPLEFEVAKIDDNTNRGNKGPEQPLPRSETSVRPVHGESAVSVRTPEQGDIVIDINDRFPRDFLSEISLQARMSMNPSGISPFLGDGAGLSVNLENHEPKHWSYFRNLAQDDFGRKDVSLMDQDHLGFSSPLTNIEGGVPIDYSYPPLNSVGVALGHGIPHINFEENIKQESTGVAVTNTMDLHPEYSQSQLKDDESAPLDRVDSKVVESEYENTGAPLLDLPLVDFDISTLQIIKNEDLEELRELGSGTFGTVYHGKWRGTDVAIKRIKKSCFTGRSSEQERLTVEFWREADILSKLHHPNVVAFYGVVQDGPGATLATVTEFMVNGSLRHVLLSKDRQLDRRKRLIIAMDAAFGMEYLHSKNIVHFDLKCDNLLVNLKDPARPICKVGDFGLSKIKRNTLVTGGVRGTLPWMAPELLNGSSSKVSEKVDVFSFGIVLWEILTGEEPYANMHYGAIIGGIVSNTLRPHVPNYCDPDWRLLMEQCWAPDPAVRPSFTEIARRLRVMSTATQTKPHGHQQQNSAPK